jgi:hypothetical protein
MPDAVKGGLFVGAAVATGLLVGLFAPSLVGPERERSNGARADSLPVMPSVIDRPLDVVQAELRSRGIAYETDAPHFIEATVPDILDVCDSEPAPGTSVRRSAQLHVALAGTCHI